MAIRTSSIGSTSERMRATWNRTTTKVTSATSTLQTFLHLLACRSQAWLVMHPTHFLSLLGFARHGRCRQDLSDIATSSRVLRRGALKLQPCAGIQSSTGGDGLGGSLEAILPNKSVIFFWGQSALRCRFRGGEPNGEVIEGTERPTETRRRRAR